MMEGAKMLAEEQEPVQEYLNKLEKLRAEDKVNPQRTGNIHKLCTLYKSQIVQRLEGLRN